MRLGGAALLATRGRTDVGPETSSWRRECAVGAGSERRGGARERRSGVIGGLAAAHGVGADGSVAEPPELFQLKCPSHTLKGSNTLKQE
jgi:hypothetical protein